jgi:hypothetical protein
MKSDATDKFMQVPWMSSQCDEARVAGSGEERIRNAQVGCTELAIVFQQRSFPCSRRYRENTESTMILSMSSKGSEV